MNGDKTHSHMQHTFQTLILILLNVYIIHRNAEAPKRKLVSRETTASPFQFQIMKSFKSTFSTILIHQFSKSRKLGSHMSQRHDIPMLKDYRRGLNRKISIWIVCVSLAIIVGGRGYTVGEGLASLPFHTVNETKTIIDHLWKEVSQFQLWSNQSEQCNHAVRQGNRQVSATSPRHVSSQSCCSGYCEASGTYHGNTLNQLHACTVTVSLDELLCHNYTHPGRWG